MSHCPTRHAIIIGGGASGVLLTYQLLQKPEPGFRVTLIEQRPEIGRGPAYYTSNPEHVLNVRAANMSALPDDPEHFWRWLSSRAEGPLCPDPYCFVPRRAYGDYLASLIAPLISSDNATPRLAPASAIRLWRRRISAAWRNLFSGSIGVLRACAP